MPSDYQIPSDKKPENSGNLLVPITPSLLNQAKLTLKGTGLSLLKQKFLTINASKVADQETANSPNAGNIGYDKKSVFGMPIWDTLTFKGLSYEDFQGQTVNLGDFTVDIALFEVYNPRHIIITPITGRNGDIKEYMSDGDYIIKINGSLINPTPNTPPEQLLRGLNAFCKAQVEIEVTNTFLSYLDIFYIVIMEPKFTQRRGERNIIDYELDCRSEVPFQLKP